MRVLEAIGGVIATVGGARVDARVVGARILRKVDLVAGVVHVSRAAKSSRAHDRAVDARCFHTKRRIVHVLAFDRLDVVAIPRLWTVVVY